MQVPYYPKSNAAPPAPRETAPTEAGDNAPSLEYMLRHWALIPGTSQAFDELTRTLYKRTPAIMHVGRDLYDAWVARKDKRQIPMSDVPNLLKETARNLHGQALHDVLARYVVLYGGTNVWDRYERMIIGRDALRLALGSELYKAWENSEKKEQIIAANLVFDPSRQCNPETHINMFEGLTLKPDPDHSKCRAIIDLVHNLCLHDGPEAMEWMLNWMAYQVQHVGAKMATAALMHGPINGTGKSMLWEGVFKPIFGQYGATVGQHQLESQYTDWRSKKLFVLFEEIATRTEKFNQMGAVKHMVTGNTHRINQKFVSEWEEQNHMNVVILSNEFQPLPLEETDRRFLVIWTQHLLSAAEQAACEREIKSGGVEAFYHFLLHRDLGDFNPHTKPPMTLAKRRVIDYGLQPWEHFLRAWQANELDYAPWCCALSTDVYAAFKRYCNQSGQRELSEPKVLAQLGVRVRKERLFHTGFGQRRLQSIFVIDRPYDPALQRDAFPSQEAWLGAGVKRFSERLA